MAGRKEYELLFKLQAVLGSGFSKSFNSAMNAAKQLQGNLSEINKLSGKIDGFQKQTTALEKNREKLAQLTAEHARLQQEMSQTEQPSEELRQKMERNERQIAQTTAQIERQEARLNELGTELREAGVDTDNLTAENERLAESYDRIKQSQERLANIAQAQQANAEAISKTKTQLAGTLATITAGGAAMYKGAIQPAIEFESAFAGVKKTISGTPEQLLAIQNGIRQMSTEIPSSVVDIAAIAEAAGQLGIQTDSILTFTRTMADLGVTTNLAGEEAASTLAKFANITGMSQGNFDRLGSTIVALGNNLATTEADIAAMGLRLAGAGEQVGLTEAEILSFAGALSSVGIEAEAGGSAFSKVMVNMQLAAETGGDSLEDFASVAGMSAAEFKEAFQTDAAGAMITFIKGLGESEERGLSAIKVLDDMGITEVRLRDALLRAAGAGDVFANAIDLGTAAWEENNALQNEAQQRYATTESQLQILKQTLNDIGISIGSVFLPYIAETVKKVSAVAGTFSKWAQENPELIKTIVAITAGLAGLKVAGLVGKLAFLDVKGGILAMQGAWAKMKAFQAAGGLKGLFGGLGGIGGKLLPIIGIVGGIAVAIKLISGNLEEVRGWIRETFGDGAVAVFDKVWGVIQNVGAALSGIFSDGNIANARNFFEENFGEAGVAVFDALIGVVEQLKAVLPGLLDLFARLVEDLLPVIGSLIQQLLPLIGQIIASILPVLANLLAQIIPIIGQIINAILPVLIQLIETLLPVIMQIIESVLPVVITLITTVVSAIQPLVEAILPILQSLLTALMPIIQAVADLFGNVLGVAITAISGILDGLTQILSGLITFITGVFTGNWTQAWEGVKSIFSGIWQAIKSVCVGVVNGIISVINGVISGLNKLKIPDWVPGLGGMGINIPLIPMLAKGSKYTPETFIAGEKGAELITNARGRTVFTAAQTGRIMQNINAAQSAQTGETVVTMLPLLQAALSTARVNAGGVSAPSVTAGEQRQTSVVIHSAPVFHVGSDAQAEDIEELLNRRDEELLQKFDDRANERANDERRRTYD